MFAFRLCLALGYPHPDHLLRELTAEQFAEWQAYHSLEPWGFPLWSWLAGMVASVVANFSPASKKHNWTAADFMPKRDQQKKTEPDAQVVSGGLLAYFKNALKARKAG